MSVCQPADGLSTSVLVLNRFYMAVHVINVRRAFTLLFRELAEVVHLEQGQFANYNFDSWREISELKANFKEPHDDWIKAVNFEIQVPRVIRLLFYDRLPKQVIRFNRRNIFARDGNRCQYCGKQVSHQRIEPGPRRSAQPRRRHDLGEHRLQLRANATCKKGGRTPQEAHMHLIRLPVKPKRSPLLSMKLGNPKYESWKTFLDNAYWSVDLK